MRHSDKLELYVHEAIRSGRNGECEPARTEVDPEIEVSGQHLHRVILPHSLFEKVFRDLSSSMYPTITKDNLLEASFATTSQAEGKWIFTLASRLCALTKGENANHCHP